MSLFKNITEPFSQGLKKLGFEGDTLLFLTDEKNLPDPLLYFYLEIAKELKATAVYFRLQLNGSYKPQVYLFDFTDKSFYEEQDNSIAAIQTKLWSSGEVPLACFFFNTEIKIVDCTKHITKDFKPEYLISNLNIIGKAHDLYNEQFAVKIKTGIFWEQEELKKKFKFQNSAYDILIKNIRNVSKELNQSLSDSSSLINKIIVQAILIKYLEERIDTDGNKLLSEKYFKKYDYSNSFTDVLLKGKFVDLLIDLNEDFNGNVFTWNEQEQEQLQFLDLKILAEFLSTDKRDISSLQSEFKFDLRYFEFKYIPVELISRLYEEFLGEDKQEKGLYYTPSHLAKLLVDECIPLKKHEEIKLKDFKILDPACGSGIFLVVAFKRLVQIWRLQNKKKHPDIKDLKLLLRNVYGVDKEEQAIKLASFSLSLALCNELNPIKIINELRFDDLTKENLIHSDFFNCNAIQNKKFDLIIGNPPYVRGGTKKTETNTTTISSLTLKVPNNQLALKFLGDSYNFLKPNALQCLLVKSSGVLYNSTSKDFLNKLFINTNIVQIFDFTALARNSSLWDNKKYNGKTTNPLEVDAAAIFIKNELPNFNKNILHLTFRRNKATKDRIFFEIDDYDFHFINRLTAINNQFIWKNNLLGGGRIINTIDKLNEIKKLKDNFKKGEFGEGIGGGKSLHNQAFLENHIDNSYCTYKYISSFNEKKDKTIFQVPNFLIKENIDLPFAFNNKSLKFSNEIVGFHVADIMLLQNLTAYFKKNKEVLKFFNICTSGKMLVYKNTACKQEDILNLPVDLDNNLTGNLSVFDKNIINDVNNYMQLFLRNGENSKAVKSIKGEKNIKLIINNYGTEFSRALNTVYEDNDRKFRLSDVVELKNSMIAVVFKFDTEKAEANFHKDLSELNIENLTDNIVSEQLSIKRIIKLYPQKNTIVFVKPNQYRYWLSLTAYRDADKCFADFSNSDF